MKILKVIVFIMVCSSMLAFLTCCEFSDQPDIESFPNTEEGMLEKWDKIVSSDVDKIGQIRMYDYFQSIVSSVQDGRFDIGLKDTQDISELLSILNIEEMKFEKILKSEFDRISDHGDTDIYIAGIQVYVSDEELNELMAMTITSDGYIYMHSAVSLDYTFRSTSIIDAEKVKELYSSKVEAKV